MFRRYGNRRENEEGEEAQEAAIRFTFCLGYGILMHAPKTLKNQRVAGVAAASRPPYLGSYLSHPILYFLSCLPSRFFSISAPVFQFRWKLAHIAKIKI